jgi:hypothetical protein
MDNNHIMFTPVASILVRESNYRVSNEADYLVKA